MISGMGSYAAVKEKISVGVAVVSSAKPPEEHNVKTPMIASRTPLECTKYKMTIDSIRVTDADVAVMMSIAATTPGKLELRMSTSLANRSPVSWSYADPKSRCKSSLTRTLRSRFLIPGNLKLLEGTSMVAVMGTTKSPRSLYGGCSNLRLANMSFRFSADGDGSAETCACFTRISSEVISHAGFNQRIASRVLC